MQGMKFIEMFDETAFVQNRKHERIRPIRNEGVEGAVWVAFLMIISSDFFSYTET